MTSKKKIKPRGGGDNASVGPTVECCYTLMLGHLKF